MKRMFTGTTDRNHQTCCDETLSEDGGSCTKTSSDALKKTFVYFNPNESKSQQQVELTAHPTSQVGRITGGDSWHICNSSILTLTAFNSGFASPYPPDNL